MPKASRAKTSPIEAAHPPHLNFSFREWLRRRTELVTNPLAWTPLPALHADYVAFCAATAVPEPYVHAEAEISGMLRAHQDREPEQRLVEHRPLYQQGEQRYELCFPRRLIAPIRVAS